MALPGWLATRLMGLAGEFLGSPGTVVGPGCPVCRATPSGMLHSRSVSRAFALIAFVRGV